jgi:hypothetical protein
VSRKQVIAAVVAVCTVVAAVIGFAANVVTIAEFVGGDAQPADARPADDQPVPTAEEVGQPPAGRSTPQGPATPRVRVVPRIAEADILPQPYEPGAVVPEVPAEFHGRWVGVVYQESSSNSPYPVEIDIRGGRPADVVASVTYPSLDCGGTWRLNNAWERMIKSTEVIDDRDKTKCVDTKIELSTQPDGQVYYAFESNGGGYGVLRRP